MYKNEREKEDGKERKKERERSFEFLSVS